MKLTKPQLAALKEVASPYGLDAQFKPAACKVLHAHGLIQRRDTLRYDRQVRPVWYITTDGAITLAEHVHYAVNKGAA